MSRWTHVIGAFRFNTDPHVFTKDKNGNITAELPYPDEQFILKPPSLGENCLKFDVSLYSLPKVKPLFEKFSKEFLPHGEFGLTYFLNQQKNDHRSSSNHMDYSCDEEIFEEKLTKLYEDSPLYRINRQLFEVGWIDTCSDFTFTVDDDIRWCSGYQLMAAFERLFAELSKEEIWLDNGCIEWFDEYESDLVFSIRKSTPHWGDACTFMIFGDVRDRCVASKVLIYDFEADKYVEEKSENWDELMKQEEES